MNTFLAIGGTLLGLLPMVMSPTRTFARGGKWRYVGAALIVVSMMSLFWSVRDLGLGAGRGADDAAISAGTSDPDVKALENLFRDAGAGG